MSDLVVLVKNHDKCIKKNRSLNAGIIVILVLFITNINLNDLLFYWYLFFIYP